MFCEEERGVKCQKCNATLNMAQGQDAEVVRPACYVQEASVQAGGAWAFFSKLLRTQAQTVPKKMRRQVTCRQCKVRQGVTSIFIFVSVREDFKSQVDCYGQLHVPLCVCVCVCVYM